MIVLLRDGRELELEFVERTEEALVGRDARGAAVVIDRKDVVRVQMRRIAPVRTAVAVAGLALLLSIGLALHDLPVPWPGPPQF